MFEKLAPAEIEKRSFEIITSELEEKGIVLDPANELVIKRCIHTSADFEYAETLSFSEGAVEKMKELIRGGACIVTDTNMALAGINKKALASKGCCSVCFMADENVAKEASERGVTRAAVSMERAALMPGKKIFAIGNAPTALMTLSGMIREGEAKPDLVIGAPVGFVNVVFAKEEMRSICDEHGIPYIMAMGRKGGSTVAAAIVNALLYHDRQI